MRLVKISIYSIVAGMLLMSVFSSCSGKKKKVAGPVIYKGIYSFGPEVKTFQECGQESDFWVTDSSSQLELQYSQLNFEKPYEPVYIEVEGEKRASGKDGLGSDFDSTLVVKKLIKISKEIPQDTCH